MVLFYGLGAGEFTVTATTDTFRLVHDAAPPAVWLEVPRRVYSGSVSIPLAWGAVDRDSGVAHYDLDVRVEGGVAARPHPHHRHPPPVPASPR